MTDRDPFGDRKRGQEEDYFRRRDQELIAKMRRRAEVEAERRRMAEATGIADEEVLRDLQELGFTPESVRLLHLAPLVQIAWAEGKVTARERELILKVARLRGVEEGQPTYQKLAEWLDHRPSEEFFQGTLHVLRAMLMALPPQQREASQRDLVSYCTQVAAASGGIFGLSSKISEAEQASLERVAAELQRDHAAAVKRVLE